MYDPSELLESSNQDVDNQDAILLEPEGSKRSGAEMPQIISKYPKYNFIMNEGTKNKNSSQEDVASYDDGPTWKFWTKKRYIIASLAFFGFFNLSALRSLISIAIVDMTTLKNITLDNGTIVEQREFNWDSKAKGYILSSFFYGYIGTQILGGYLATKFGGAKIYGMGIASSALFTLITPIIAKTNNIYLLIALRAAEGLFEGVNFPSILSIWAKWAPPLEKSRLTTIAASGNYVGTVVAMPISSLLATNLGWESIFYVFGGFAVIWYILWVIIVRDSPSQDPRIDPKELKYITESLNASKIDKLVVPWGSLLTSKPVWTMSLIIICEAWGFYTLLTFLPQMMKSALDFELNQSGVLTALPYIAMAISVQASGQVSDRLLSRGCLPLTWIRKLTIFIGFIAQAVFLFASAFWVSPYLTPVFIVSAATFGGIAMSGILLIPLDIAPRFASIIYGINNTFATIPGIVSPIITGYIVSDMTNLEQWKTVLFISSGLYVLGAVLSLIFVTGEVQMWAKNY